MNIAECDQFCEHCFEDIQVSKIIQGTKDHEARKKLLLIKPLPTLTNTTEICRSLEHAEKNDMTLSGGTGLQVNRVQNERKPSTNFRANGQNTRCKACNRPHRKDPCPAVGKTCFICGELNHMAPACSKKKTLQTNVNSVRTEVTTINRVETPTVIGKKLPEMEVNLYDLEGICLGMSITAVPYSGDETGRYCGDMFMKFMLQRCQPINHIEQLTN